MSTPLQTILVVDDDPRLRSMLRRLLEHAYRVVEAADGLAALAQIESEPPDVILLDVLMPRLDRWGVLQALRDRRRLAAIPVVLVTGHVLADEGEVAEWGVAALLPKPFRPSALFALVADLLGAGDRGP